MLNSLAKFLLTATSLAPILGAVAVNQFSQGKPWTDWAIWLAIGLSLTLICWGLLVYSANNIQTETITISEFESEDKEVLAFLLAYLLPFISAQDMSFTGDWMTGLYILVIIFIVITHAGAFHFNPVMGLLGYHFYSIKKDSGMPVIIISKRELNSTGIEITSVKLSRNIYLDKETQDA
jgi:drug/metabolite transporter (DMT)-like permease